MLKDDWKKPYDLICLDWTPPISPMHLSSCTWKRRLHSDILFLFLCVDDELSNPTSLLALVQVKPTPMDPHLIRNRMDICTLAHLRPHQQTLRIGPLNQRLAAKNIVHDSCLHATNRRGEYSDI